MNAHNFRPPAKHEDPVCLVGRALTRLKTAWLRLTYPFAFAGDGLLIHYSCNISRITAHRISLGNFVRIGDSAWLCVSAPQSECGTPVITLADYATVGFRSILSAKNCIIIEPNVIIAQSVLIMDHAHNYDDITVPISHQGITDGGRIRIGEGSWIGHGAAIVCSSGELVLGQHCVVAANSLVTRSFPAYSVIAGNPARVVRQFDPETGTWALGSVRNLRLQTVVR